MNYLKAYIATCAEFDLYFRVADGVAYAYGGRGERLGYIMPSLLFTGGEKRLRNAVGLLTDVLASEYAQVDFSFPGRFITKRIGGSGAFAVDANGPGNLALQ